MTAAKQFSKYGSVAIGSAVTDYAVFALILWLTDAVYPAQMVARIAGGLFSFVLNKYWSFKTQSLKTMVREARRFLLLYAFSYFLALGILYVLVSVVGLSPYPAKISADLACFVVNFIVMKSYVFSDRRGLSDGIKTLIKSP